jgi:dihydrofolate reductase
MRAQASSVEFDMVAAAEMSGGIGANGALPWRLPSDVAHLKKLTTETSVPGARNAVIMGRVTWDTIPPRWRPLPGRFNVVVTRQIHLDLPEGAVLAGSLDQALVAACEAGGVERIFVLGGGDIYRQAIQLDGCQHIYLTRVIGHFPCDTFFPPIPSRFGRDALLDEGADDGLGYRIERWSRIAPPG